MFCPIPLHLAGTTPRLFSGNTKGRGRSMDNDRDRSDSHRIVVTGLGLVTPLGVGKDEFSRRLFEGVCAIDTVKSFDTSAVLSHLGAEVRDFTPRDFISVKNLRRMDKTSLMTAASARMALDDAGVTINAENRDRIGILLGTSFGATDVTVQVADALMGEGPSSVNPILVPNTVTHFAVSAETAIAYAVSEIKRGAADFMLAGGVDILSKFYYESMEKFHGLSPDKGGEEGARPFDMLRNGYVVGEGCGILCLESLSSARNRGARIYCEITGSGMGSSPTLPTEWPKNTEGILRTCRRAMNNAGVAPGDITTVMAAANGDRVLDAVEARAYDELFDVCEQKPYVTSVKGSLGESFSSGGIRACALALSVEKGWLPPRNLRISGFQ
ncbi:MAG: hypothetical protein CVU51_13335 [Deltaproteobacteria bacterium HGW-Deltaproteobacteria-1]|nr:MAG: hypothetical protein CVU51_13335 [Deltaproteobacteria bacterium HGW-Deltaproteobacteria-1]